MRYESFGVTVCGNFRRCNEDNFYLNGFYKKDTEQKDAFYSTSTADDEKMLAAVFDGIGGMKSGEAASLAACRAADQVWRNDQPDVAEIVSLANDMICRENETAQIESGCTSVIMEFDGGIFRSWNLGDSRAYLVRDGVIKQMSKDHTEEARIMDLGEQSQESRKGSLTQYLGISESEFVIEPYISDWEQGESGDSIILCSDGLSGHVEDREILECISSCSDQGSCVLKLMEKAVDSGSNDNITIIKIDLE